jgi:NAD(P)-dependent dehydrogenase (short-subunit alcohol dehydrogenase family)
MQKTWFITGAGRGLGAEIVKAALLAGDRVVATGRRRDSLLEALGPDSDRLLSVALDVSDADQAAAAAKSAVSKFGGIDVLVNNAGYGLYGFFEETDIQDAHEQFATNVFGVLNVTWAVLPVMRAARRGQVFNVSSLGGLIGGQMASFYCATKFAVEGFSESIAKELSPFGISVTILEPGPFRTDFLTSRSLRFARHHIAEYDQRRTQILAGIEQRNGQQPGDPRKLAEAIVHLANEPNPPMRFLAGALAVNTAEDKLGKMRAEIEAWRELSLSTDGNYADANADALLAQIK